MSEENDKGISRRGLLGTATIAGAAGVVGTVSGMTAAEFVATAKAQTSAMPRPQHRGEARRPRRILRL